MDDKFLMSKEDYVLNSLGLGVAAGYLCNLTGKPLNFWTKQISEQANAQYDQLTPEQIDKTIEDYLNNKAIGNDSITRLGDDKS